MSPSNTSQWNSQERENVLSFVFFLSDDSECHTIPFILNYLTSGCSDNLLQPGEAMLSVSWNVGKPQGSHQLSSFLCSQLPHSPDNNDRRTSRPSPPGLYQMLCPSQWIRHPQRPLCGNLQGSSGDNQVLPTSSLCTCRYSCRGEGCKPQQLSSHWLCSSPNQSSRTASLLYNSPRNVETNGFQCFSQYSDNRFLDLHNSSLQWTETLRLMACCWWTQTPRHYNTRIPTLGRKETGRVDKRWKVCCRWTKKLNLQKGPSQQVRLASPITLFCPPSSSQINGYKS